MPNVAAAGLKVIARLPTKEPEEFRRRNGLGGAVRKLEQKPLKRVVLSSGGIRLQQLLGPDCQRSPFG